MERDARIAALSLSLVCAIPLLSATRDTASAASARAQMGLISGIAGRCMNGGESLAVGAIMTAGGCCCDASSSTMVRRAFVFCVRAFFRWDERERIVDLWVNFGDNMARNTTTGTHVRTIILWSRYKIRPIKK